MKIRLIKYTTYKCGRIQKAIIAFLMKHNRVFFCDTLVEFKRKVDVKVDFYHFVGALKYLQRRLVVVIE